MDIGIITSIKKNNGAFECVIDYGAGKSDTAILYSGSNKAEHPMIDDQVVVSSANNENIIVAIFREDESGLSLGESIIYGRNSSGSIVSSVKCTNDGKIIINGGSEKVVKGDTFKTSFENHVHPTAFGPSGKPATPLTPANFNDTVLV